MCVYIYIYMYIYTASNSTLCVGRGGVVYTHTHEKLPLLCSKAACRDNIYLYRCSFWGYSQNDRRTMAGNVSRGSGGMKKRKT